MEDFIQYLLSQGLYIIPLHSVNNKKCTCGSDGCTSIGKHPFFPYNWKVIATNDPIKINDWNMTYNLNFGVATGRKSTVTDKYFIVLDIDKKNHEILDKLPETLTIKTGEGIHKYFWAKYSIKNSVSLIDKNVDIRGKNGYSIIPPSNHISGNKYEVLSKQPYQIAELPEFLYDSVFQEKKKEEKKASKTVSKKTKNPISYKWNNVTVKQIRNLLNKGEKIPSGTRNNTCFKLLCSERAKGMKNLDELIQYGKAIRNQMENKEDFSDDEINLIANSVIKYPTYDNSFENINSNYIKWLKNHKILVDNEYEKKLDEYDNLFFSSLEKTNNFLGGHSSLVDISKSRDLFFASKNILFYSRYKLQFLAQKLKSLGFERKRKAKGNFWLIKISV